jgi:hypothetical protein
MARFPLVWANSHRLFGDLLGTDEFRALELEHNLVERRAARKGRHGFVGYRVNIHWSQILYCHLCLTPPPFIWESIVVLPMVIPFQRQYAVIVEERQERFLVINCLEVELA